MTTRSGREYKGSRSIRMESEGNNGEGMANVAINTGNDPETD